MDLRTPYILPASTIYTLVSNCNVLLLSSRSLKFQVLLQLSMNVWTMFIDKIVLLGPAIRYERI